MRKKLLIAVLIIINVSAVSAQWTVPTFTWSYPLKKSVEKSFTELTTTANSTSSKVRFLPSPTSGTSRVLVGSSGGGFLLGDNGLTLIPSNPNINKFSVFDIPEARDIAAVSFNVEFIPTEFNTVIVFCNR